MWAEEWAEFEDDEREFLTCLARDIIRIVNADSKGAYSNKITKKRVDLSNKYDELVRLILRCRYLYDEAILDRQFWKEMDELRKSAKLSEGRPKKTVDPWAEYYQYYVDPSQEEILRREKSRPSDPLAAVYLAVRDWWVNNMKEPFRLHYNLFGDFGGYSPAGKLLLIIARDCLGDLDAAEEPPPVTDDEDNEEAKPDPLIPKLRELHSYLQRKTRYLPPSDRP